MRTVLTVLAVLALAPIVLLAIQSALASRPTLGLVNGKLKDCPATPNAVSSQTESKEHFADPILFEGPPETAWSNLRKAVESLPRTQIIESNESYLYAESTSKLFRFVDDVEFVLDGESKTIHFRSASRVGKSDLGVNRTRIEEVRKKHAEFQTTR